MNWRNTILKVSSPHCVFPFLILFLHVKVCTIDEGWWRNLFWYCTRKLDCSRFISQLQTPIYVYRQTFVLCLCSTIRCQDKHCSKVRQKATIYISKNRLFAKIQPSFVNYSNMFLFFNLVEGILYKPEEVFTRKQCKAVLNLHHLVNMQGSAIKTTFV